MMERLTWFLLAVGFCALAVAGTARTMLFFGEWNQKPLLDRYVDWIEQRLRSTREATLFRLFWLGLAIGLSASVVGLLLLLRR